MTDTLERTETDTGVDNDLFNSIIANEEPVDDDGMGDEERFSHYVSKEDIVKSSTQGIAVRALCGKKWTPSRNPEKFPVCPDCKKVYDEMQPGD